MLIFASTSPHRGSSISFRWAWGQAPVSGAGWTSAARSTRLRWWGLFLVPGPYAFLGLLPWHLFSIVQEGCQVTRSEDFTSLWTVFPGQGGVASHLSSPHASFAFLAGLLADFLSAARLGSPRGSVSANATNVSRG
jgi:hypothetical protein